MSKKKGKKIWLYIVIPVLVVSLLAGYALSASGRAKLQQWFGGAETVQPPEKEKEPETTGEDVGEEPAVEPTPGEEPAAEATDPGGNKEEPGEKQGDADEPGETPIIFIGQRLAIPGTGKSSAASSLVITNGTLSQASGSKQIALTFDSGWEYTHCIPLLKVLDDYKVKATFFPRADWLNAHPDLCREIIQRGHYMGNHSKTHPEMTKEKMSAAAIREEMRQSTRIIRDFSGMEPYLFRPPYGSYDAQLLKILAEEGYPYTVMWSIDTIDWDAGNKRKVDGKETLIDEDFIVNRVLKSSEAKKNNGIVLMHIGGDSAGHLTVKALPRIIEGLRSQGYSFNTVNKMLPTPASSGQTVYTVVKGDTLYSISRRYGVTVQQLIEANNL